MNPYTSLASKAVKIYIKEKKVISPDKELPDEMLFKKAGVFVTIEKGKKLRGCIGTFLPTKENIAQEIISNAIAAATRDSRFYPVYKDELEEIEFSVYILGEPERIKSIKELDPKKYGVIVSNFSSLNQKGLLLPDLEGVDTAEKQVQIASHKAGIDLKKDKIILHRFTVKKYK